MKNYHFIALKLQLIALACLRNGHRSRKTCVCRVKHVESMERANEQCC